MEKNINDPIGNVTVTVKENDFICIGDDIKILIRHIGGHSVGKAVMIRVSAPKTKRIFRQQNGAAGKI